MKIRIKFRKYGLMKFVGHLDLMRFFQKAIRRCGIDICYTKGFSPHQIMSFAAPLGLGLTSDGEYLDIEVHASASSEASIAALNREMVEGMEITGYVQLDDKAKPAMSVVSAADYEIWPKEGYTCPYPAEQLREAWERFFDTPERTIITKKTKKGEKTVDLKKPVFHSGILEPQERFFYQPGYYLDVSCGSTDNLKPELVLEAFYDYLGLPFDPLAFQIHRLDVYENYGAGQSRRPLLAAGTILK